VFQLEPEACQAAIVRELGINNVRCATVALEEMFVELAGGNS
jgi:hypothetical protein